MDVNSVRILHSWLESSCWLCCLIVILIEFNILVLMIFIGKRCETGSDNCTYNQCQNGAICNSNPSGYTCTCPSGYTGRYCQNNVNECTPDPCVHGNCSDLAYGYHCICEDGYTGKNCSEGVDDCYIGYVYLE